MKRQAAEAAAEFLLQSRLERVRMARLPEAIHPAGEDDGYLIQDLVHAKRAATRLGPVAGLKIGCTTPVMQAYLNIGQPCAGGIAAATVHRGKAARVAAADYVRLGVECEIAVELGAGLPAAGAPYDRSKVAGAVAAVMPAMELVDDRYADYGDFGVASLIADDFFNAGCVLGPGVHAWRDLDLAAVNGTMWINGREIGRGTGADIMGHPFEALAWIANRWAALGRGLEAGSFVMLGSVVQTQWLQAGDTVRTAISGLGELTLQVG